MGNWKATLFQKDKSSYFKKYKAKLPEIILILVFITGGLWRVPLWANMLGSNTREILEIDVALGRWLAENTPVEAVIAVDDIGAVTYISQRRIVDLNGLVSPEMWPRIGSRPTRQSPATEAELPAREFPTDAASRPDRPRRAPCRSKSRQGC